MHAAGFARANMNSYIDQVLRKCSTMHKARFWVSDVRERAWINNFSSSPREQFFAAWILDHFVFFSDEMVDSLFKTAFSTMCQTFRGLFSPRVNAVAKAEQFLKEAVYTRVEGENPNPTDSGNLFCRKARQKLEIDESRIVEPALACEFAFNGSPVIFLDDFTGSGEQLRTTFTRRYRSTPPYSFFEVRNERTKRKQPFTAIYICLVATETALSNLQRNRIPVQVYATHIIGSNYSVKKGSPLFDYVEFETFLRKWSSQLELHGHMKKNDHPTFGFHELGLTVAFQHSVPDATIPIIWAPGPSDWQPLYRRS